MPRQRRERTGKRGNAVATEDRMRVTTVALDPATYQELRLMAAGEGTNVRALIREAVEQLLVRRRRANDAR